MMDVSHYKQIGETPNTIVYIAETDPDILIIVPREGTMDNAEDARANVAYLHEYARKFEKSCGSVVIMSNMLGQEPEARRAYQEIDPALYYGGALVVESPLSRALGSFFVGLTRPKVPVKLFNTIENAVEWLKTMRRL